MASTTNPNVGPKQSAAASSRAKKKKKNHTEAATQFPTDDGINNDQNTKYHHKTAIFADFRCTLKNE